MMTDPLADMLTRIRNANTAFHDDVIMPSSKLKEALMIAARNIRSPPSHMIPPAACWSSSGVGPQLRTVVT